MGVSTITREQRVRCLDRFEQVKGANRAAGAEGFLAFARDHERRPVVALDHARGRDADDAPVPAFAIDHDAVSFAQRGIAADAFLDQAQNSTLFFLAICIEAIKFGGQFARARGFFHAEQFDHVAGYIHAPGGVDARRNAERNFHGSGWTLRRNLRHFEQRLQPGIDRPAQSVEAQLREHSILPGKRHRVGDGGDGHHFHE